MFLYYNHTFSPPLSSSQPSCRDLQFVVGRLQIGVLLLGRAEARALEWREQAPGAGPAMAELARFLRVQNPQESMLRLTEVIRVCILIIRHVCGVWSLYVDSIYRCL